MHITLDLVQTLALAAIMSYVGTLVKSRIVFLQKYFIPAPVIGGLIYSLIMLIGYLTGSFSIELDNTLTPLLLIAFFTATGFEFSIKQLKKFGSIGLKLALIVTAMAVIQNAVMPIFAPLVGLEPLMGLTVGSMSMIGGPGAAAAFGPTIETLGVENATLSAIAAATAGLVVGSLIGGPVAKYLINRHKLDTTKTQSIDNIDASSTTIEKRQEDLTKSVLQILFAMGAGMIIVWILDSLTGFAWPEYVGGLFFAVIMRNVSEPLGFSFDTTSIGKIGSISLNIFLALTIMDLQIWNLLDLALPIIGLIIMQVILLVLLAIFIFFRVLGSNYDAAVMTSGLMGVSIGSTPNAVANMDAVIEDNNPSPISMLALPIVVSVVISLINSITISIFINLFS